MIFSMPAEWQGCGGQAAGRNSMGQLCSQVDPQEQGSPLDRAISVPISVRAGSGLSFKAALYGAIKAKDCLCCAEQRDGGPGWAAITHSPLNTWGLAESSKRGSEGPAVPQRP